MWRRSLLGKGSKSPNPFFLAWMKEEFLGRAVTDPQLLWSSRLSKCPWTTFPRPLSQCKEAVVIIAGKRLILQPVGLLLNSPNLPSPFLEPKTAALPSIHWTVTHLFSIFSPFPVYIATKKSCGSFPVNHYILSVHGLQQQRRGDGCQYHLQ